MKQIVKKENETTSKKKKKRKKQNKKKTFVKNRLLIFTNKNLLPLVLEGHRKTTK